MKVRDTHAIHLDSMESLLFMPTRDVSVTFWSDGMTSLQAAITLKRAAGEVVASNEHGAKKLIVEEVLNLMQSSTDFALPTGSMSADLDAFSEPRKGSLLAASQLVPSGELNAENDLSVAPPLTSAATGEERTGMPEQPTHFPASRSSSKSLGDLGV
ncbi:hypothetical protein BGW42_002789 [Actinomortierella wolfii]|nr:hypothetical protein BGW42_002789 [Actinomortierella wolfii]